MPSDSRSSYWADAEDPVELARLIQQDQFFTQTLGLFPPAFQVPQSKEAILDIACGPGGWALDVAKTCPNASVVGIDISRRMLASAELYARAEAASNVQFVEMDARQPLGFSDNSFYFVNARLCTSFMTPASWPALLAECYRVLQPGGTLRIAEFEVSFSNSLALDTANQLLNTAAKRAKMTFSPTGRSLGIAAMLKKLFLQAGFTGIKQRGDALDCSYGSDYYAVWVEDVHLLYHSLRPFLLKSEAISEEELETLWAQVKVDLGDPDFCCVSFLLSAWGMKPQQAEP